MRESAKRHEENSNLIKEIRATTDAAIRNQGASIKTLEIQIGQMSKVLAPKAVLKVLECLCASFYWGATGDTKKLAWIKWSTILASLDKAD
ncbi:hypothetical protein Tco_1005593 [Tanacetum coccineum]|uniref:Uncharacterized protein n=1 Tax=Tanacetum coccineum TaxID=301880 RepID=A0ABQ5FFF8_9ASTR